MSSKFNARNADSYEQLMAGGAACWPAHSWSSPAGEHVADVGCGTRSLTLTIPQVAEVAQINLIDFSPIYVEAARQRDSDPRITISQVLLNPSTT